ncbi:amidohydrolase [Emcibacter sp.]|uniref:amidohydrolase n=1 Tax=Emcibacter sp. TaxID=1979954 RepID=UPI002AA6A2BA|nr:amidohydrolase [Emcibacter sp.]
MKKNKYYIPGLIGGLMLSLAAGTTAFAGEVADKIFFNGHIYTMEKDTPRVEAVAIRDGKFMAVGSLEDMKKMAGEGTELVDLDGKMAMPGLNDGHSHPTDGAIANLFSCKFEFTATPDDIAETLKDCVKRNPDSGWIVGGRWDSNFFENYDIPSPREWLDQYAGGKAVYFSDDSGHNGWANTKALELAGMTKDTPDPAGGTIVRDPGTGEPNGILLEEAQILMEGQLPDWTDKQYLAGVREMARIANGYGITGIKDANAREPILKAYKAVDQAGDLNIRVAASISTPYGHREEPLDYERISRLQKTFASERVNTWFVKLFDDGVPTVSRTAAMLEPYIHDDHFPENYRGKLHLSEDVMTKDVAELEKRGFTVKIHTAGDRSIQTALNAIERAHKISGRFDLRHELAHAEFIAPEDIPRFRELNVVADLSPYLWHPSPIVQSIFDAVGEEKSRKNLWHVRDLLEAGAPVLAGSDWPAAVPSMNPWVGIEAMVTRKDPYGKTPGSLGPDQAISLEQALRIFTIEGAKALRLDKVTGSIKVGKSADMIVLDHNIFETEADKIADTKIEMLLFDGDIIE